MKNNFKNLVNRLYKLGIIDKETKDKYNSDSLFEKVLKKKEEKESRYIRALENNAKIAILMEIADVNNEELFSNKKKVLELLNSLEVDMLP